MAALHVVNDEMTISTWYAGEWLVIIMRDVEVATIRRAESDGQWVNKPANRHQYQAFKTFHGADKYRRKVIMSWGNIKLLTIDWATVENSLADGHSVIIKRDGLNLNITTMSAEGAIVSDSTLPIGRSEKVAETWLVTWLWSAEASMVFVKDRRSCVWASLHLGTAQQKFGKGQTPLEALEKAFDGVYA